MEKWFAPAHQVALAGKTVNKFGYDTQGTVEYKFNSQGFRSCEFGPDPRVVVLGNSVTFGLGLTHDQTLGHLISKELNLHLANLSFGCYLHTNHDHLHNLNTAVNQDVDTKFVIQINNLNRVLGPDGTVQITQDKSLAVKNFLDYFDQAISLLKNRPCAFVYWDDQDYDIPKSVRNQILIHNQFHVDQSIATNNNTFGPRSHWFVSRVLSHHLKI